MMKKLVASCVAAVMCIVLVACSTSWVNQAIAIANVALPATLAILQVAAIDSGHPLDPVFSATAEKDFQNSLTLLNDYKTATADAKPGILGKVQAELQVTKNDLSVILPSIRVMNPQKQAEITVMVGLVLDEVNALASLASSSTSQPTAKLSKPPLSAGQFKSSFNTHIKAAGHPELAVK